MNVITGSAYIRKDVCEIRFKPKLSNLFDLSKTAGDFEDKYKSWIVNDNHNAISLFNDEDRISLISSYDKVSTLAENNLEKFPELLEDLKTIYSKSIEKGASEIRRVGLRRTLLFDTKLQLEELAAVLSKKLFNPVLFNDPLQIDSQLDLNFVTDFLRSDIKFHLQIGPLAKEQFPEFYKPNFDVKIDDVKDVNLYIDIDVSKEKNLEAEKVNELIKELENQSIEYSNNIINLINS